MVMKILESVAKGLAGVGVSANAVTLAGFLVNAGAGVLAARGMWIWAAAVAVLGGVADLLDGKIARLNPNRGKFGALLDSSLDRYGDAFLIAGIGYYFSTQMEPLVLLAAFSAMAGSFEISYVRARAEGLGFECRIGFWERGERWVLLLFGLIVMNPAGAVLVLAVMTHLTAFRRILHIRSLALGLRPHRAGEAGVSKWARPINWAHAAAALAFVGLVRHPF